MPMFKRQPPPAPQSTRSPSSRLTAAAQPDRKPGPVQPPGPKAGTALASSLLLGEIRETKGKAQEAVNLLESLTAPPQGEQPSQIQEILAALTAILESQRRMEQLQEAQGRTLDRLSRLAQPRPV